MVRFEILLSVKHHFTDYLLICFKYSLGKVCRFAVKTVLWKTTDFAKTKTEAFDATDRTYPDELSQTVQ